MTGRLLALQIAALAFLELVLLYLAVPLVPRWQEKFVLSGAAEGIALGAYSGAIALLSLPFGALVDRLGARVVTLISTIAAVVATPLIAYVHGVLELVAVRFLQGAFAAGVWTAGLAWIVAAVEADEQGRAIGRVEGAAVIGSFAGPLLGGPLAAAVGLRQVVFALAALALALFVGLLRTPAGGPRSQAAGEAPRPAEEELLRAGFVVIVVSAAAGAGLALIAPLVLARDGLGGSAIGGLFAAGAAVAALGSATITTRLPLSPRTAAMFAAAIGAAAAMGALGGGSTVLASVVLVVALSLQAIGFGYAFRLVAAGAPPERRGRTLAAANTLGATAGLVMPVAAGGLADLFTNPRIGLLAPAAAGFAAAALSAAQAAAPLRRLRRPR